MIGNQMLKSAFSALVPALLLLSLMPASLFGDNGKLTGKVYDAETGEPLPGANVIIESVWLDGKEAKPDIIQGAVSDLTGYFVILNVRPGTYNLKASMMGYAALTRTQVRVSIDRTITVDFPLKPSAIEMEAVTVVAEREVIKPDVSGTQETIVSSRIAETPVLRMDEFVNKIKGVELVANNEGHGLSIRGGGIRETDVMMDGISLRDPRSENSYLSLNSTAVEELQVLTGGFEAKYGGIRSGLVNVVTKEGQRDRYRLSLKTDQTPGGQKKFFGANPWSNDSWIYRVFADTSANGYAWRGTVGDTTVPEELRYFKGWKNTREGRSNYEAIGLPRAAVLTPVQKLELWKRQHPQYEFADKPDIFVEGTLTGPVPGGGLPFVGSYLGKSVFLVGFKYEDTQYAFPLGPRNNYVDWNGQLKLTTQLKPSMKLSLNSMYAKVNTISAGRPSTFGGALIDNSSRFNFLSSTEASVRQQAQLLGGSSGFIQMFNKSRLQYYDQRFMIGGAKFTHTISPKAFYTLDFQFSYTDHELTPFALDTSRAEAWFKLDNKYRVLDVPNQGTPNGSTNWLTDITNLFWLYGGLQAADTSYSWVANLRGDLTAQLGRHHQVETGFNIKYNYLSVNAGTWLQSEESWTPDLWQYFTAKPLEIGAYVQDKLEFKGMIANIGLRADYFNPNKKGYAVEHPLDEDYANFYNLVYQYLPGKFGSWEKWVEYRKMLDQPPGWPATESKSQLKLAPRLGVSFPITLDSKLYFNYGHFYQRPNIHFLYNQAIMPGATNVPSPDLEMARTVAYEFGYEQSFWQNFLFNITFYYKDVKNEPLSRSYVDYWEEQSVQKYFPDFYKDIRGLELRLEKRFGRFVTLWGNYEYMLQTTGRTGLAYVYENRLRANEEIRDPNIYTTDPIPRAQGNLNLHSPKHWGPGFRGIKPLSDIYLNFFVEWRDGGKVILNPQEPVEKQRRIEVVDYSNVDLRASKQLRFGSANLELVVTVQNLLNQKRLTYGNMSTAQYDRYKESLHLPFESGEQHGNDKLGDWNKPHIDIGWFTAPLFLNPRRVLLGLRLNI
ncbi:MAG: TonB-dependent receptor [candidate division KSB1 bacterium]|nr:TonB-dependent receptor [candidate division KSB1 bacterium]MDZ7301718.1 TonB-dependent receptor [candidate division KSB1 bacterium]MDZ7312395.1 TonB-dependent receptor [candidate division KSB1 bacterium]